MKNHCIFCSEGFHLNAEESTLYDDHDLSDRFLYESDNFYVKPTVGCIVCGYLLIIAKRHIPSSAELSINEKIEVEQIIQKISTKFLKTYGTEYILYEHGPSECRITGSCIDHMHLHIIPLTAEESDEFLMIAQQSFEFQKISSINEIERNQSYLYMRTKNTSLLCYTDSVESQFFRKIIAHIKNIPDEWNWTIFPFVEKIKQTILDIGAFRI